MTQQVNAPSCQDAVLQQVPDAPDAVLHSERFHVVLFLPLAAGQAFRIVLLDKVCNRVQAHIPIAIVPPVPAGTLSVRRL
jgi:hypothetical protein